MPGFLSLVDLAKSFGGAPVLDQVSLDIVEGEILVLLGPSGSGKTTLLRLIAGFETPDRGAIRVAGREVTGLPPERRNFGMVFQHYALFPHLSVGANVAFGLRSRGVGKAEARHRVSELLPEVDLAGFEERRIHQLSGGQQQRVALARALAPGPRVLLLDEPLSNLDPSLRERTRRQLRQSIRRVGITAVWVTHEQDEAFHVGDRVALLHRGRLEQVGRPEELYGRPASGFVARFVGRASTLDGVLDGDGRVIIGEPRYRGRGVTWRGVVAGGLGRGTPVELVTRPEGLELVGKVPDDALAGVVAERRFAGESTFYRVELEAGGELLVAGGAEAAREGDLVAVRLRPGAPPPRVFRRGGTGAP